MRSRFFNPFKELGIQEDVRLIIYSRETKSFIINKTICFKESIKINFDNNYNLSELRYKYQLKRDNRWVDGEIKYLKVFDIDRNALAIKFSFLNKDFHTVEWSILDNVDEKDIAYVFKNLLLITYDFLLTNPTKDKIQKIRHFLSSFSEDAVLSSNIIAHYHAQTYMIVEYLAESFPLFYNISEEERLEYFIQHTVENYFYKDKEINGVNTGLLVAKGNFYSQFNRSKAYDCYKEALTIGKDYMDMYLEVDAITTYYKDIGIADKNYEVFPLNNSSEYLKSNGLNVVFSADENYFKMFATDWARTCYLFNGLTYSFGLVVTNEVKFHELVNNFSELIKSIADLTECKIATNFNFYWVRCEVINKTQYACARFYLADYIIKNTKNDLYITDIDQLVMGDLETYLQTVAKGDDVQLSILENYFQLIPGRCYMAGNIYLKNSEKSRKFIELMVIYILHGIDEEKSWILDQNATRYAVEHVDVSNVNLNGKRPIHQFKNIKRLFRNGMLN